MIFALKTLLGQISPYIIYCLETPDLCLAAEGDTADRLTVASGFIARGKDATWTKIQSVGKATIVANRRPVAATEACTKQIATRTNVTAPDKHQRRLHNSIRIS